MALKHKITVNVANSNGSRATVLRSKEMRLPSRLAKLLFGDYTQVLLLAPGKTVESVDIRETGEGGIKNE